MGLKLNEISCDMSCCKERPRFNGSISHKYKMIYFKVPKCGSWSMQSVLDDFGFIRYKEEPNMIANKYPNYYKFTIVRNPFDRIYSCWKYYVENSHIKIYFMNENTDLLQLNFNDFVDKVIGHYKNHHWNLALNFLPKDDNGKIFLDEILKLETINKHIKVIENILHKTIRFPHLKKSFRDAGIYTKVYNQKSIKKILTIYKEDFFMFNYKNYI